MYLLRLLLFVLLWMDLLIRQIYERAQLLSIGH
jgi:hypothetical protein